MFHFSMNIIIVLEGLDNSRKCELGSAVQDGKRCVMKAAAGHDGLRNRCLWSSSMLEESRCSRSALHGNRSCCRGDEVAMESCSKQVLWLVHC